MVFPAVLRLLHSLHGDPHFHSPRHLVHHRKKEFLPALCSSQSHTFIALKILSDIFRQFLCFISMLFLHLQGALQLDDIGRSSHNTISTGS